MEEENKTFFSDLVRNRKPYLDKREENYSCECVDCGHTVESSEHCRDIKCPECGGEMRRKDRPGTGK